ncbi:Xaa-Pro peptidase family protein [Salinisphaera sp. T31B1]|uniref:M24 family metallopeptidase n=1 Tax=Salinisphaera sp. T31B1 TaxID=727963 RepID=UPI00333F2A29
MDYADYRARLIQAIDRPELAFDTSEYDARLSRVRAAMASARLDLLVLTEPGDLCYLTGYRTFEVSVQCALLVSDTATVLFVPAIEIGPAVYLSRVDEVVGYAWESPVAMARNLSAQMRRLGGHADSRVGAGLWSGSLRPGLLAALQKAGPVHEFIDIGDLVENVRLVKSAPELAYLDESAAITATGLDAAARVIDAGVIDHEIASAGAAAMLSAGSEFMSMQPIVTTGRRSGIIHTNHDGHRIARGDVVFTEFGAVRRRYTAPLMRTAVVGTASAEIRRFHEVCLAVLAAVMDAARVGATFDAAARAGEQALAPIAADAFFSGVYGYPVGIQFPPSWVAGSAFIARGNERLFEPDMVFHLPICLRKPAAFGVGFSETVRITDHGAVPITRNDLTLAEIG